VRLIKLGFISVIFFALLITGFSLFIPSHVIISKAINIGATRYSINGQLSDIAKWKNWYPGFDTLPLLGSEEMNGKLLSAKIRDISILITGNNDSVVSAEFRSNNKRPVINKWRTFIYTQTDSVTLQWSMDFHLNWYPWEKFSSLLLEKRYAPQMEQGLSNLKALLEKNGER
jgi:hypothetical protein